MKIIAVLGSPAKNGNTADLAREALKALPSNGLAPTARFKNFWTDRLGMFTVYTSSLGAAVGGGDSGMQRMDEKQGRLHERRVR